ncbi:VIT and vWA domain-containing protein [Enemella evansiae]|uniref:VIT and vWA domain-containing protein n=1 Tax=Enemella evansiae TaxID=2016499 RepID=UPI00105C741E|nr:VIT and VWA domain-containing protein [Enemella evansiae]TDO89956.1 Ca-activated chloride channel family protein [Enemella evansiae]
MHSATPSQLTPAELAASTPPLPPGGLWAPEGGPLPLQSVRLTGTVDGILGSWRITQTFRNDRDHPIEAVYTFPLPDHVAVTAMTARLGDRDVDARLAERGQARADYAAALAEGQRAALVEQERGDVFTAQLGNLAAGEEATITLELAGRLAMEAAEAALRIPLVVAERYLPGTDAGTRHGTGVGPDTDRVPDGSRITPPRIAGRTGVDLAVSVRINAVGLLDGPPRTGPGIEVLDTDQGWELRNAPGIDLNADLVARFGVRPQRVRALLTADHDDPDQGTWQAVVTPPEGARDETGPRRLVLALDRSGSMSGWKMVAARRAAARIIDSLGGADSFAVLGFDHTVERPGEGLTAATDHERFAAVRWLSALEARGGTELREPLLQAADLLAGTDGERVLVLVTDGQVGNEAELLSVIAQRLTGVRIYCLGIDQAVNAAFLRRLAAVGGGRCDLVESEAELDEVLTRLHRRIAAPLARGLTVAIEGVTLKRDATVPRLADLFPAGPAVLSGRWHASGEPELGAVSVTVLAETDEGIAEWPAEVGQPIAESTDVLRNSWARARMQELQDRRDADPGSIGADEITEFSLAHGILSPFTAWLAVGPGGVTEAAQQVVQPVAQPAGWAAAPMLAGPDQAPVMFSRACEPRVTGTRRTGALFADRAAPAAAPPAAAPMAAGQSGQGMPALDLTPFGARLAELVQHWHELSVWVRRRAQAELVSDLESVGAPAELVQAVAGLPERAEEVRRLWREITGAELPDAGR